MSKLLGLIALTGLLSVGLAATSNAQQSFTVTQPDPLSGAPSNTLYAGVTTNGGDLFTAQLTAVPAQVLGGNSTVGFGSTQQFQPVGPGPFTGSYTNVAANFTFDLTVPATNLNPLPNPPPPTTRSFEVDGLINGNVSFDGVLGTSDAHFEPVTVLVDGVAMPLFAAIAPNNALSWEIANLDFGTGMNVNVYFDQRDALTAPNVLNFLAIGGYVQSTVPEPGAVALLAGMGISGSVFLGRKRRRV